MAYPSAHAAYSVAWVVCAVVLVRGGSSFFAGFAAVTAAVVLAAVVGLTRVYLRAHYLSDVVRRLGARVRDLRPPRRARARRRMAASQCAPQP